MLLVDALALDDHQHQVYLVLLYAIVYVVAAYVVAAYVVAVAHFDVAHLAVASEQNAYLIAAYTPADCCVFWFVRSIGAPLPVQDVHGLRALSVLVVVAGFHVEQASERQGKNDKEGEGFIGVEGHRWKDKSMR